MDMSLLKNADAVIVLNGGADENGELFQDTKNRVAKGVEAATENQIANIIMVGHESKEMRAYALTMKLPPGLNIWVEDYSHNTVENAHYTKTKFLEPNNWHSVILVTEKFHSKRSKLTFDLVLGKEYAVKSVDSEAGYTPQQRHELVKQEDFYIQFTKDKLADIKPSDNNEREKMLSAKREVTTSHFPAVRV
jgi:uncharacterized SAM-binding protein YcdF (DUF218 family)